MPPWLSYTVEVLQNLSAWSPGNAITEQVGPAMSNGDGVSENITVRILPIPGTSSRFVRLSVVHQF